jgi:hypothetical protein
LHSRINRSTALTISAQPLLAQAAAIIAIRHDRVKLKWRISSRLLREFVSVGTRTDTEVMIRAEAVYS